MKYKMIAIDMDGTLLTDDKRISERNMRALKAAMEAGVRVCIATGRAWQGSRKFIDAIVPNAPVINSNGSMITDPSTGEILFNVTIPADSAKKIIARGNEWDVSQIIWYRNILYGNRIDDMLIDYGHRFGGMDPTLATDTDKMAETGISKILWHDDPEKVLEWRRRGVEDMFDGVFVCTSEPDCLELYSNKVSKARAVGQVGQMYGIGPEEIITVGDGGNDIPMLKFAGLGIAVANARDEVRAEADEVTLSNEEDGVAAVIEKYFL